MTTKRGLLEQAIFEENKRHDAALAAIQSRAPDISVLERLVRALQARGWRAEALVEPRRYGLNAAIELVLLLSCSEGELLDVMEYLTAEGIHVARGGERRYSREYALRLATFTVRMNAYVHTPARVAA